MHTKVHPHNRAQHVTGHAPAQRRCAYHNDRLEPRHQVLVRLARRVAVVVLVGVTQREFFRVRRLDLLVRHTLAHTLPQQIDIYQLMASQD